jgi:uncharacterized protein (TIGR03435 family)
MPTLEFAADHLWQSTAFAAVAALLALALRANHARARYWLWLAASVKFLIPFSVLAAAGSSLGRWLVPAPSVARLPSVMEQIVQPFAPIQDAALPMAVPAPVATNLLPALLLALWFCGFVAVLLCGWGRWRRVAAAVRASTPLTEGREVEAWRSVRKKAAQEGRPTGARRWFEWGGPPGLPSAVSSNAKLEPGVFGIFRPVLWLPASIGDRLSDAELEAILAHELCHVRRRDNLSAAIHMAVEAIFWFHPLVWWLGARLTEERERACDEEVVQMGGEPQVYAESILKVCEFYLASPLACAAGVTGGELKKRIEGIMTNRFTRELNFGKKALLAAVAVMAVAGPIAIGVMNPPRSSAQAQIAPLPSFEVASVKPTAPSDVPRSRSGVAYSRMTGGPGTNSPGQFTAAYVPLRALIVRAYGLRDYQLFGPPSITGERYDIAAKIPPGAAKEQVNLMLQDLLVRRFGLVVHWEKRDLPVYELVVAKGGLKMKEAEKPPAGALAPAPPDLSAKVSLDKDGFPVLPPGVPRMDYESGPNGSARLSARMSTVADLAGIVGGEVDRPIIDKTGLAGTYDFNLLFVPERTRVASAGPAGATDAPPGQAALPDAASDAGPSIFVALERQLGLKLEPEKRPFSVLVVDKVNRTPTEN